MISAQKMAVIMIVALFLVCGAGSVLTLKAALVTLGAQEIEDDAIPMSAPDIIGNFAARIDDEAEFDVGQIQTAYEYIIEFSINGGIYHIVHDKYADRFLVFSNDYICAGILDISSIGELSGLSDEEIRSLIKFSDDYGISAVR